MEEDLNEDELEERLYAMIHYVDDTQQTVENNPQNNDNGANIDATPISTLKRYWRTKQSCNKPFQKVNAPITPKPATAPLINSNCYDNSSDVNKPKHEKLDEAKTDSTATFDMSIFNAPIPDDTKTTVQILENDEGSRVVELESSDEDEVVEVAIPPKPTITIESSDEDDIIEITAKADETKIDIKEISNLNDNLTSSKESNNGSRESASPVPSVVSSVSDEFIRSDCIALKISSRKPNEQSFDFSLHGSDLLDQNTPSRKKKKKNKEANTPTTLAQVANNVVPEITTQKAPEECFATPKSKQKKKQKTKTFKVTEPIIPNADVYDSDSNQSVSDLTRKQLYYVDDKSCPSVDVYESDSSQSEIVKDSEDTPQSLNTLAVINASIPNAAKGMESTNKKAKASSKSKEAEKILETLSEVVDLTEDVNKTINTTIEENIVFGNVTGFQNVTGFKESDDYGDIDNNTGAGDSTKLGSTKIPAILSENLDFDYLKGQENTVLKHRYSLKSLRAEMEKFYNESWGGENFNHKEIQKTMSRDRSLWEIDPKDRMPIMNKRKVTCNYCNRIGHRDDTCRMKPPICHMCGSLGHYETRCPNKICVNCGSPNYMFSTVCRNCSGWSRVRCQECGQCGHPATHCPDLWRRYHNTIDNTMHLEQAQGSRKHHQLYCSGCTRRGHLVNTCRICLPFSGLPINSPYVFRYQSIYPPTPQQPIIPQYAIPDYNLKIQESTELLPTSVPKANDRNKRQSKSPTCHITHTNKKRTMDFEVSSERRRNSSYRSNHSESFAEDDDKSQTPKANASVKSRNEKNSTIISDASSNHDKNGEVIQDNEVSDSSVAMTTSRIYVTNDVIDKLKTGEGNDWLNEKMVEHNVVVNNSDVNSFLAIKGTLADQEAFQANLRDWASSNSDQRNNRTVSESSHDDGNQGLVSNIPKNRNNVLRQLNKAFESLKEYLGDPNAMYKELNYLQNHREKLMKQKVVSPKQLSNNKDYIKEMLKKLNMILLGQAGLADGFSHLQELQSIQKKLSTYRHKELPMDFRKHIGEHYKCIFAALPRDDYEELIKIYYQKNQNAKSKRKNRRGGARNRPQLMENTPNHDGKAMIPKKVFNFMSTAVNANVTDSGKDFIPINPYNGKNVVEKTLSNVSKCYGRLMSCRPSDSLNKKLRLQLARRMHSGMASFSGKTGHVTSKQLKKLKKITEQAQLFITSNK